MEKQINQHWYDNKNSVFILCILIFPVGLYGLWKNKSISNNVKHIVSALFFILFMKGVEYIIIKPKANDNAALEKHLLDSINQVDANSKMKADSMVAIKQKMSNEEAKSYVLNFEKRLSDIEAPALNAIKQSNQFMRYFSNGQTSVNEMYEAAKIAKQSCDNTKRKLYDVSLSENLPDSISKMLQKILGNASTAYFMREEGYEILMEYCDNRKPSDLSAYGEKMEGADNFIQCCGIDLVATKMSLGIPFKKSKKKNE